MADNLNDEFNQIHESAEFATQELRDMANKLNAGVKASSKEEKSAIGKAFDFTKGAINLAINATKATASATGEVVGGVRDLTREIDRTGDAFAASANLADGVVRGLQTLAAGSEIAYDSLEKISKATHAMYDALSQQKATWSKLSKVGIAVADGMTGSERIFLQSKMSLDQFNTAMAGASESLALMYGSASRGGEDFSKMLGQLSQGDDMTMRNLGMTADDMVTASTSYMKVLSLTNRDQQRSVSVITTGAQDYAQHLDLLSRLTGESRETLAKQRSNEIENNDRLLALITTRDPAEGDVIWDIFDYIKKELGPNMAQAYLELNSGVVTEKGQEFIQKTGIRGVRQWKSLSQAMQEMQDGLKRSERWRTGSALVNEELAVGKGLQKTIQLQNKDSNAVNKAMAAQEEALANKDEQTADSNRAEKNLEATRNQWNEMMISFMPTFAEMAEDTASTFEALGEQVEKLPEILQGMGMNVPTDKNSLANLYEDAKGKVQEFFGLSSNKSLEGLNIKSKESIGGGGVQEGVARLAQTIQTNNVVPGGLGKFTAFNDEYHQTHNAKSKHTSGLAMDFTLTDQSKSEEAAAYVSDMLLKSGMSTSDFRVIDEYKHPSGHATGGHIHVQFSNNEAAQKFAELTGTKKETAAEEKVQNTEKAEVAVYEPKEEMAKPQKVEKSADPNWKNVSTGTGAVSTKGWEAKTKPKEKPKEPSLEQPGIANLAATDNTTSASPQPMQKPAADLTVPKSNYESTSVPDPTFKDDNQLAESTIKKTMSFDETLNLLRDMKRKVDNLEKTSTQELAALTKAAQKAKV